jgi:hypothetical protein
MKNSLLKHQKIMRLREACNWYGVSLGGALCYINNPTIRLFSILVYIRRVTMTRRDGTKSTNNMTNNITIVVEPLARAAFRMIFPMLPSKQFNRLNKLK